MYVIMTRVKLKPETHETCARIFQKTNPGLVENEPDWLDARMVFDAETNVVTVMATWRSAASYKRLAASSEFQKTMQKFAELFASPPEISINSLLVEMEPQRRSD